MKYCKCKESTSSVNSKCVECGGDMSRKWEKARRELKKYHDGILKKKCKLCGSGLDSIMYEYCTLVYCTNKKCEKHDISEQWKEYGLRKGTPSVSSTK